MKISFFILLGKDSLEFGIWWHLSKLCRMDSSTISVSSFDSLNAKLCCPWKRGVLMSLVFLRNSLSAPLKLCACSAFCQISRVSPIKFLKFTSKLWQCSTVLHWFFTMTSSSGSKFEIAKFGIAKLADFFNILVISNQIYPLKMTSYQKTNAILHCSATIFT